jgi:predicted Zn-dependent protease
MKETEILVSEFREKTEKMLESIKKENYDKLNFLIKERHKIIVMFMEKPEYYDRNTIREEFKAKHILELNKQVNELTKKKFLIVKEKLQSINSSMLIKNRYEPGFSGNSLFFNKKVF